MSILKTQTRYAEILHQGVTIRVWSSAGVEIKLQNSHLGHVPATDKDNQPFGSLDVGHARPQLHLHHGEDGVLPAPHVGEKKTRNTEILPRKAWKFSLVVEPVLCLGVGRVKVRISMTSGFF